MVKKLTIAVLSFTLLISASIFAYAQGKHFEDVSIIFFPGGNEGGSFASVVYRGAKAAEEDLGCKVDYVWSGWLPDRMVAQFKDAVTIIPLARASSTSGAKASTPGCPIIAIPSGLLATASLN